MYLKLTQSLTFSHTGFNSEPSVYLKKVELFVGSANAKTNHIPIYLFRSRLLFRETITCTPTGILYKVLKEFCIIFKKKEEPIHPLG